MTHETDSELIDRTLAGDRFAAQRLVERHRRAVTSVAYQVLGNADDAQDVAQEALVYALQRLGEVRDRSRLSGWLRQLTLSLCVDYRRRRGTRRSGEPITVLNEAREETDYSERLMIRQAVAHLSDAQRAALLLHYIGGWSIEEVAGLLAIPVNTVRSRLTAARSRLRADLSPFYRSNRQVTHTTQRKPMSQDNLTLSEAHTALLYAAFPGARILTVENNPEPWMPYSPRISIAAADGTERTVDFRAIDPIIAGQYAVLHRLGNPTPRLIYGPVLNSGRSLALCEPPVGENLLLWALGGTPHRIRLATERTFEAIDRLQAATDALLADPIGAKLTRRTLADEAAIIGSNELWKGDPWLNRHESEVEAWRTDPWFTAALARVQAAVADIDAPLVFTNYLHFFPNWVRIEPGADPINEPMGWPGDRRLQANPIAEYVEPSGYIGDPLLGLAMVWIYDCYPFVHTGFVEQYLWRMGVSRREFAPRLALRALQTIARELPIARPTEGGEFWDSLHGYVEQGLAWMV